VSCAVVLTTTAPALAQDATEEPHDDSALPPAVAPPPSAEPERIKKKWNPEYVPDATAADWIGIGVGASFAIGGAVASPQPKHWTGGVLFDESVRNTLRMPTAQGRYTVRDASDVGLSLLATWPFLVDALVTAWYTNGDPEIAKRMAIVDAEALAIIGGIQETTTAVASRERPYARNCGGTDREGIPDASVDCNGSIKYRSFFSGHSGLSFAAAGLVCVHHLGLDLLGGPGDALSCAGAYTVASTTALFRIMGDMHYATDVLTGAAVGSLVGIGIPLLRRTRVTSEPPKAGAVRVDIIPVGAGLGIGGLF
jgi:membrane-associated phospholipid phosphatase